MWIALCQTWNQVSLSLSLISHSSHGFIFRLFHWPFVSNCDCFVAPALQSGNLHSSFDENWLLKVWCKPWSLRYRIWLIPCNFAQTCNWALLYLQIKGGDVLPYLNGMYISSWWIFFPENCLTLWFLKLLLWLNSMKCITGMMGSGKTTVSKILSEALGYSFVDRWVFCLKHYKFLLIANQWDVLALFVSIFHFETQLCWGGGELFTISSLCYLHFDVTALNCITSLEQSPL